MFLTRRFYIALVLVILLLGSGYVFAPFFVIGQWALFVLLLVVLADVYSLYRIRGIHAFRQCADRFSNGDENNMQLLVENKYQFPLYIRVIDEFPVQFQLRELQFKTHFKSSQKKKYDFTVKPTERGAYRFGNINIFISFFGYQVNYYDSANR